MSGAALVWAKAQIAPGTIAKAVLICLADYADDRAIAWPSVGRLATEVQVSDRTIQRALKALAAEGLIEIHEDTRKDGGRSTNLYRLMMTPGDTLSPAPRQSVTPPVTLLSPANGTPIEPSPSDEGDVIRPKPKRVYPPEFEAAWKAYPHVQGRSSKPNALTQWRVLAPEERAGLVEGIARFRPKVREVCGSTGAPCMARWLRDGKHLNWLPAEPEEVPPDRWAIYLQLWREGDPWPESLGPPPNQPGTRVPPELLDTPPLFGAAA